MNDFTHSVLSDLIICSFRYALGRKTYITSSISDLLIKCKSQLNEQDRKLIIREIEEAIRNDRAGMQCDVVSWKKCALELRKIGNE